MFIKTKIFDSIWGSIEQHNNVRDLLKAIGEQFTNLIWQVSYKHPYSVVLIHEAQWDKSCAWSDHEHKGYSDLTKRFAVTMHGIVTCYYKNKF